MGRPSENNPDRKQMYVSERFYKMCKTRKALTGEEMTKHTDRLAEQIQEEVDSLFSREKNRYKDFEPRSSSKKDNNKRRSRGFDLL